MVEHCHATEGLVDALLDLAAGREPNRVSTLLAVTPAEELEDDGTLDPGVPVFTDFYLPSEGRSIDAVFGMDVSVPHGQAQGRFVSHPLGELSVSMEDDLHEVVLVAVPPWTRDDVGAFDRSGSRLGLSIVDASPPERTFEE